MSTFPDYYEILGVSTKATEEEIREAYKKKALEFHPDRYVPGTQDSAINPSITQEEAKIQFQKVADAYYVLSDPTRRQQYDNAKRRRRQSGPSWQLNQTDPNQLFGSEFEELLRPEIENPSWFYAPFGAISGGVLGFICGNVPGMVLGAYAGNKLGAVRDAKVYEAYSKLPNNHKAAILAAVAAKLVTGGRI
ncbi:5081_t:CDS:2 [Diversispora eburnea]|uniref:5081_t:CDS:1 n=1 Tax=Diversispora eburnea TaxID=1213867 RepID=A0A9N8V441_9GLOM|nr:5081_t:CDS:2 [Diversispora eburnea]